MSGWFRRHTSDRHGTTLNAEFRLWLAAFVEQERAALRYHEFMGQLGYAHAGRRFTREEPNAR